MSVVEENERFDAKKKAWGYENLLKNDPARYMCSSGKFNEFPDVPPAEGYKHISSWKINFDPSDEKKQFEGWAYGKSFPDLDAGKYETNQANALVRRRIWIREIAPFEVDHISVSDNITIDDQNDDFSVEFDDDGGSIRDDYSELGDTSYLNSRDLPPAPTAPPTIHEDEPLSANPLEQKPSRTTQPKRRSSIFSWGSRSSTSTTAPSSTSTGDKQQPQVVSDLTLKVVDPLIAVLGKQIRNLEAEYRKLEEVEEKEFRSTKKPKLEAGIAELEKKSQLVQKRIEIEAGQGFEHVDSLEEELKGINDKMDVMKKQLYFPHKSITLGQDGVYLGLNDVWVEHCSGRFKIDFIPSKDGSPKISLVLAGTLANPDAGVTVRLQGEGFSLLGDKGKGVPKLKFNILKITVALTVFITVEFDLKTQKWRTNSKDFKIKILSFKGPYGISKSIISMILSIVAPILRNLVVGALPPELGNFLNSCPTPLLIRGEFKMNGTDLSLLNSDVARASPVMAHLCGYNSVQMEMFHWAQKAMERTQMLQTPSDIIQYRKSFQSKNKLWVQILALWNQAFRVYCEKVTTAKLDQLTSQGPSLQGSFDPEEYMIEFKNFLTACDDILKKRLAASFELKYFEGQISLNHLLDYGHKLLYRLTTESITKASALQKVRLNSFLEKIHLGRQSVLKLLDLVSKNLDFMQLNLEAKLDAGSSGTLSIVLQDIVAQAPVQLNFSLLKPKILGSIPLVPYIVSMKPQDNGDIVVQLFHFSHESIERPTKTEVNKVKETISGDFEGILPSDNTEYAETDGMSEFGHSDAVTKDVNVEAALASVVMEDFYKQQQQQNNIDTSGEGRSENGEGSVNSASSGSTSKTGFSKKFTPTFTTPSFLKSKNVESDRVLEDAEGDLEGKNEKEKGSGSTADSINNLIHHRAFLNKMGQYSSDYNKVVHSVKSGIKEKTQQIKEKTQQIKERTQHIKVPVGLKSGISSKFRKLSFRDENQKIVVDLDMKPETENETENENTETIETDIQLEEEEEESEDLEDIMGREAISEPAIDFQEGLNAEFLAENRQQGENTSVQSMSDLNTVNEEEERSVDSPEGREKKPRKQSSFSGSIRSISPTPTGSGKKQSFYGLNSNNSGNLGGKKEDVLAVTSPNLLVKSGSTKTIPDSPAHLLVRQEQQEQKLKETLLDHPGQGHADTILTTVLCSPELSVIADTAVSFSPGASLFSVMVGSKAKNQQSDDDSTENDGMPQSETKIKQEEGCPFRIFTAPAIKMLVQVPAVRVLLHLPALVRFLLAHFMDLPQLKVHIDSMLGDDIQMDLFVAVQGIMRRISKYLLLTGLNVEVNLNGKIATLNGEILVSLDTPEQPLSNTKKTENETETEKDMKTMDRNKLREERPCAVKATIELNLKDVFDDIHEIMKLLNVPTEIVENSKN